MKRILITTAMGNIEAEIYDEQAPITAGNFLKYVTNHVYDGRSTFYRVVRPDNQPNSTVKIEVIQGGLSKSEVIHEKGFDSIPHEITVTTGIRHLNGTLSMARFHPGTASSEFFICIGDQPELDFGGKRNPDGQGFAAFGMVINGMDVVKKIQYLAEEGQYLTDPVAIEKIVLIED